jgi:hypothetical protein
VLNFTMADMRYEPYPLAVLRPALDPELYRRLARSFPPEAIFGRLPKYPYKLSLSEKHAPENYRRFLAENAEWSAFHAWVKSDGFIRSTLDFLALNHIHLPVEDAFEPAGKRLERLVRAVAAGRAPSGGRKLSSRFEFSVLRADGGMVEPHTDAARKIVTLTLSMVEDGEWDPAFGGGLDVNRATDPTYAYNWNNRIVPWDKIETIDTIPYTPNQCVLFVKTHNSLHSVRKMDQKGSSALRKTVTIVIERDE